jgi:hypothetical protein
MPEVRNFEDQADYSIDKKAAPGIRDGFFPYRDV